MPVKSSLSKIRQSISYLFFKDIFESLITDYEPLRKTFHGFYIYAIDGDQLALPRSKDLLKEGYCGYPCPNEMETHFLRMYLSHAYDVLSGVTKNLCFSPALNEIANAIQMIGSFESNSITLYDRLYLSTEIIKAHAQASNFFIACCKRGSTFIPIVNLFNGPGWYSQMVIEGVVIHLYKYKNPKTGEFSVLATNLPHGSLDKKDMVALYSRRWEIETTFRDFTSTMKMEQWHSTSLNGILQELYSYFWLFNYTKIQMSINEDEDSVNQLVKNDYKKPNFKLILDFIMDSIPLFVAGLYQKFRKQIKLLMKISMEKRRHFKRSYERSIKSAGSSFKRNSLTQRQRGVVA